MKGVPIIARKKVKRNDISGIQKHLQKFIKETL